MNQIMIATHRINSAYARSISDKLHSKLDKQPARQFITLINQSYKFINKIPNDLVREVISWMAWQVKAELDYTEKLEILKNTMGLQWLYLSVSKESVEKVASRQSVKYKGKIKRLGIDIQAETAKTLRATHKDEISELVASACRDGVRGVDGNLKAQLLRLSDQKWWGLQILRVIARSRETIRQTIGLVGETISPVISKKGAEHQQRSHEKNQQVLKDTKIVNKQTGEIIKLSDIEVTAIKSRFARLLNWVDGMGHYSELNGHKCGMFTITCPSRMHPNSPLGYDGTTPNQAQKHLSTLWNEALRQVKRKGLYPYGVRVVEPHKDGTPHWHVMLFAPIEDLESVDKILEKQALKVDGDERGAMENRYEFHIVKPQYEMRGGAKLSSYLFKYLAKTITSDLEKEKAWARQHGIRTVQFVGGASTGVWGALRKFGMVNLGFDKQLGRIADACRNGDYSNYFRLQGGHSVSKADHYVKSLRVNIDDSGSVWDEGVISDKDGALNNYSEHKKKAAGIKVQATKRGFIDNKARWEIIWH